MYSLTKLLLISLFIFIIIAPTCAQTNDLDFIKSLETQLFNTTYPKQSTSERLARLELIIMGQTITRDPENVRIARLQALLGPDSKTSAPLPETTKTSANNSTPNMNVVPSGQPDSLAAPEYYDPEVANDFKKYSIETPQSQSSNPYATEGDEVEDYPAVSYIENKVFSKTYKGEDITKRLDRLEQNLFSKTKSDLSLSERLDALKVAVLGTTNVPLPQNSNKNNNDDDAFISSAPDNYASSFNMYASPGLNQGFNQGLSPRNFNRHYNNPQVPSDMQEEDNFPSMNQYQSNNSASGQMSDESMSQITGRLEQQILGKNFQSDPMNDRLDRLEMKVFNRTSPNSTVENRIERLVAVSAAESTSDPNDMKKVNRLRRVQTGLSVGGMLFSILSGFLF